MSSASCWRRSRPPSRGAGTPLRGVLERLRDLFALGLIEQHRGWYLENGMIAAKQSKELAGTIDTLCAELAPESLALVGAFGIPAQCLASPIAE